MLLFIGTAKTLLTEAASTDVQALIRSRASRMSELQRNSVAEGADDMNHCQYTSKILVANDVSNKFGAGATFGPTLVDMQLDNPRNGSLATTAEKIEYIMGYMNDAQYVYNGGGLSTWGDKQYADSHYFAVPAPSIYDIVNELSFIFPFQHFIGEKNLISLFRLSMILKRTRGLSTSRNSSPRDSLLLQHRARKLLSSNS